MSPQLTARESEGGRLQPSDLIAGGPACWRANERATGVAKASRLPSSKECDSRSASASASTTFGSGDARARRPRTRARARPLPKRARAGAANQRREPTGERWQAAGVGPRREQKKSGPRAVKIMFDPRDDDGRDRDDGGRELSRGSRGPGDVRDRGSDDPRDVFMRDLDLPRSREREHVLDRDRDYSLRESETRTLATIGAFRVVSSRDLQDHNGRTVDPHSGDLRHLREQGLVRTIPMDGRKDVAVVLTDLGRHLLESHRHERDRDHRQEFYAELKKPREMEHDAQIYSAYLREAERLQERGARVERVVLDYELKREYQQWLHERDRGDGRPDRDENEIEEWASSHDLPYFDHQVHFPDLRIEYEDIDGRHEREDVEVMTVHYRGGRAAAAARSGFSCHGGSSARTGGRSDDPDLAGEFI